MGRAGMSELEVKREGVRILAGLSSGCLELRRSGHVLCVRPGARALTRIDDRIVAALADRGWIAETAPGLYRRTESGAAWLERAVDAQNPFRQQHGEVVDLPGGARLDHAPTPLDYLKRHLDGEGRPFLDEPAQAAADRLQRDFELAHLRPRMTLDPAAVPTGGGGRQGTAGEIAVAAIEARRRCLEAFDAAGPVLADLLFETVCMARGLNEAEKGFGLPQRSAKVFLRIALDRLALHYGLVSGQRRSGRIEAWRARA